VLESADSRALKALGPQGHEGSSPSSGTHLARSLTSTFPQGRTAAGSDGVLVGRIRADLEDPNAVLFWSVADNLRKGAALNAVQIAEVLLA
jgi:aspartate-semialdehyde dehydrogenase